MPKFIRMTDELREKFEALAYAKSDPFCYGCYRVVGNDADKAYAVRISTYDKSLSVDEYAKQWDEKTHGYFCHLCGSDDLMRHVKGVGVEWGIEWIIEHLIETECKLLTFDEDDEAICADFDELLDSCYEPYQIGKITFYASDILKKMDPICYRIEKQDYFDSLAEDRLDAGEWIQCGDDYYEPTILEPKLICGEMSLTQEE